jgi:hypothetical protein
MFDVKNVYITTYWNKQQLINELTMSCWQFSFGNISEKKYIWRHTNCKGIRNNINLRQITGKQEKLDTTCK